jgi:hypothetical protein
MPQLTTPTLLAYQWPLFQLEEPDALPMWLQHALDTRDLRVSDDLGHVRTPEGELTIKPGDWIVKSRNGLFAVWSNDLYHAFINSPEAANEAALLADDDPGAETSPTADPRSTIADAHNAHLEGADQPDEPDMSEPTSDPKAA